MSSEDLQENKEALRELLVNSQQRMENCRAEMSEMRVKSMINTVMLIFTWIIAISYPLVYRGEEFFSWIYIILWILTLGLFAARIKLYIFFLSRSLDHGAAETLSKLAELELEKIRQAEYDELTGKTKSTRNSPEV
jgi:hypothetical protein